MEEILKAALLGTAKQAAPPMSDHPADQMIDQSAADSPCHQLLLRAGTWAICQLAGYLAEPATDIPQAAPEEDWPCCSDRAARIFGELLERRQPELLAEAFGLLAKTGQRLPPRILPDVLDYCNEASESGEPSDVLRVIGRRGSWLCQFNDKWRNIPGRSLELGGQLPANADSLWNEGSLSERKKILLKARLADPRRGQQWLETAWASEKADTRAELLEAMESGLNASDQDFLEGVMTDASKRVRAMAARFLCRMPDSGTAQRIRQLGESMLSFSAAKSVGRMKSLVRSLTGKSDSGKLTINPPQEFDKQWEKDGIQEKPPAGTGKREFWLVQVMERIPPSHWSDHFQVPAGQLVASAAEDDFGITLLKAWSTAAYFFRCDEWVSVLWQFWFQLKNNKKRPKDQGIVEAQLIELVGAMQPEEREVRLLALIEKSAPEDRMLICQALEKMPRPWSANLAGAFIASARKLVATSPNEVTDLEAWSTIMAIPPSCFIEVLKSWDIPETDDYAVRACRKTVGAFTEIIRLRSDFYEAVSSNIGGKP